MIAQPDSIRNTQSTAEVDERLSRPVRKLPASLNEVCPSSRCHNHAETVFDHWLDDQVYQWDLQALNDRIKGDDPSFEFVPAAGGWPLNQFYHQPTFKEPRLFVPLPHQADYDDIKHSALHDAMLIHMRVQNDIQARLANARQ